MPAPQSPLEPGPMGSFLYFVIGGLLSLLVWAIIISAVLSWLVAFDVINLRNRFVYNVARFLDAVTRPILAPGAPPRLLVAAGPRAIFGPVLCLIGQLLTLQRSRGLLSTPTRLLMPRLLIDLN